MLSVVSPCVSIPDGQPSRTPYQVLGISPHERDPRAIEEAALRCSRQIRAYQLTCESECALQLNEIAAALIALLDPMCRREHGRGLGKSFSSAELERRPCAGRDAPASPRGTEAPPFPLEEASVLLLGTGEACDVRLVYRRRAV
jgi:hypothetical protein